jgi:hypothetical protein
MILVAPPDAGRGRCRVPRHRVGLARVRAVRPAAGARGGFLGRRRRRRAGHPRHALHTQGRTASGASKNFAMAARWCCLSRACRRSWWARTSAPCRRTTSRCGTRTAPAAWCAWASPSTPCPRHSAPCPKASTSGVGAYATSRSTCCSGSATGVH